jgi:DNA-binding response OmpR family regulator
MKRLLLIDDDAVLTRAYRDSLSRHGFQVNTVGHGAGALIFLESAKPDLVVLDLMLPEVTGVDVLKFVRGHSRLADTPVVVLSNDLRNDLGQHAARIGIQKAFRKDQCSPSVLMGAIDEILEPIKCSEQPAECTMEEPAEPAADAATSEDAPECRMQNEVCSLDPQAPECELQSAESKIEGENPESGIQSAETLECRIEIADCRMESLSPADTAQDAAQAGTAEARASLLANAPTICADLGELVAALARESLTGLEQQDHLQDLFCKVRFLEETARQAGLAVLGQTAGAFDALLQVLMEQPERLGPSALRTLENLVEVVGLLFERARDSGADAPLSARVLILDDDAVANEMVVAGLRRAQLDACSTEDSVMAWQWINSAQFDLVLLRLEMPVLNGVQLCERLRRVPGYEKTPVIFVAAKDDLATRTTSFRSDADDLIAKPVLPQELAAMAVMELVGTRV